MAFIYKYLPPERLTYFEDQLLRFTQPSALNDPYECQPALAEEVISGMVDQLLSKKNIEASCTGDRQARRKAQREHEKGAQRLSRLVNSTDFSAKFYSAVQEISNAKWGVLSLSRRWDSALMWSHYASSHTGFCIGFRRDHEFFNSSHEPDLMRAQLTPVAYSKLRPKIMSAHSMSISETIAVLCTKSPDWSYEEEERLVDIFAGAKKVLSSEPYSIALFEVPHAALAEIVLGIRIDKDIRKAIIKSAARLNIPVFQARLSKQTYDVERSKIER